MKNTKAPILYLLLSCLLLALLVVRRAQGVAPIRHPSRMASPARPRAEPTPTPEPWKIYLFLSPTKATLSVGDTLQLKAQVDQEKYLPRRFPFPVSWIGPVSLDPVCSVDQSGKVTALRPGQCWVGALVYTVPNGVKLHVSPVAITVKEGRY
jgi:hypothetical protein